MDSMEQERIKELARRIAARIAGEGGAAAPGAEAGEVATLRASLAEVKRRLQQLEARSGSTREQERTVNSTNADTGTYLNGAAEGAQTDHMVARSPWLFGGGTYVSAVHPSEQRFGISEAVTELVDYFEAEKTCEMEPGGKPCDHCGMCSARGF
jgi:hypothetical protein